MQLQCLICGNTASDGRRGLCSVHYSRFNAARRRLPAAERDSFEEELIEKKLLLPAKPKGRQVDSDIFADLADKRLAKKKSIDHEVDEIVREAEQQIKRARPRTESRPKRRKASND